MRSATFAAVVSLVLLGTTTLAQSVTYDFDRAADFSKFKSYAWTRGTELVDQLNHLRVVRSIENQLAAKGLTRMETTANADLFVSYHVSVDRNLRIDAYSSGWGGPFLGGMRSGRAITQEVLAGTLVVDLVAANTERIVWRGVASAELDPSANPERRDKHMNKAAQKLFKNYPPKS